MATIGRSAEPCVAVVGSKRTADAQALRFARAADAVAEREQNDRSRRFGVEAASSRPGEPDERQSFTFASGRAER
ncbi:MAG: hypothetical protein ACQEUI_04750 [Actinomycetota bacterium]